MKKQNKLLSKKQNISLRRKLASYYHRLILTLKLFTILFIILFVFTDTFKLFTDRILDMFYNESAKYGFVLENLIISGKKNTSYDDIISILKHDKGTPIFSIDINDVRSKLEDHIWINYAIVERRLPSTISICLVEHIPVAIWQFKKKLYLVDSEGNRISKYKDGFEELIHVVGQDANIYARNLIEDLKRYPNIASEINSAVRYGRRRWNLNFKEGITVKMPEHNFVKAYDYLHSLDKNKKLFNQNYKILDLRNSSKYYLEKY